MVQSFVTVSTVQLLGQRAYAARANPGPKWLTDTERRFRARCEPADRPSGASICVAACWGASFGLLCAFGPAGAV
jgi:hypothetical protein